MILLDTSVLIAALTSPRLLLADLEKVIHRGEHQLIVPTLVLYEWWRGPRLGQELAIQKFLFPAEAAIRFGAEEALVAARLYRQVKRARTREVDLAIAACAINRDAALWTLNPRDFADIPGLTLASST